MHRTKKKSKTDKIPKPIKIKKEKTEEDRALHPMSHFVDDRLELVKQIFGTLKPKTITNLAPEFMKKKSLDEIEEACLNELLCISTKRLLSIINNTKCPTDTESSDDSDVERKEEHISLEEISSDSEIDGSDARKVKNKKKKANNTAPNKNDASKPEEKTEPDGQISVLELLELQARARAIRSQLALEPVTKIEVDSDEEHAKKAESKDKPNERTERKVVSRKERKRKSSERERPSGAESTTANVKPSNESTEPRVSKKVKLKRNYRTTNSSSDANEVATKQQETTVSSAPVKVEKNRSRSASPDVIPIQAEPETLLISDSSADEAESQAQKAKSPAKELETQTEAAESKLEKSRKVSEMEEGELPEQETAKNESVVQENANEEPKDKCAETAQAEESKEADKPKEDSPDAVDDQLALKSINNEETTVVSAKEEIDVTLHDNKSNQSAEVLSNSHDDDDQNDDVISIEGGDLETEMNEQLAKEDSDTQPSKSSERNEELEEDEDVISLDTSEDEREKSQDSNTESWHTRYLKSSKVSQVLAASRLGKRVRDKIKKSKHSKKDDEQRNKEQAEEEQKKRQSYSTKHEDGSVEQYKELLELRQRKS